MLHLRYLIHYPRNFDNEYEVFAGPLSKLVRLKALLDNQSTHGETQLISRAYAIGRGWREPNTARRRHEQWFGGFATSESMTYPNNLEEAILGAAQATEEWLDRLQSEQEGRQEVPR